MVAAGWLGGEAFLGAEHVDIPDPRGGLQCSRHGQGSTASSSFLSFQLVWMMTRMSLVKVFFRTFPKYKKCTCRCESECEGARELELIRAECSSIPSYR